MVLPDEMPLSNPTCLRFAPRPRHPPDDPFPAPSPLAERDLESGVNELLRGVLHAILAAIMIRPKGVNVKRGKAFCG